MREGGKVETGRVEEKDREKTIVGKRREGQDMDTWNKCVERDKGGVYRDLGSSSGLPHLVLLPHEGVVWQAVCAAVKQHQRSPSLWKQGLWLFIHPNPAGLFTH